LNSSIRNNAFLILEILKSRILARDAVKDLKLYVEYRAPGRVKSHLVYKNQAVNVDLDSITLDQWDKELLDSTRTIELTLTLQEDGYAVKGTTLVNGKPFSEFQKTCSKLSASVRTSFGVRRPSCQDTDNLCKLQGLQHRPLQVSV
jgi:NifB/MoaA-like Fe-S oxidoreductase